jgi:uncharacterized protein (TIGR03435 family)
MPVYALAIAKGGISGSRSRLCDDRDSGMNGSRTDDGKSSLTGKNLPLENLVRSSSNQTVRSVDDHTALTGKWNFK